MKRFRTNPRSQRNLFRATADSMRLVNRSLFTPRGGFYF